MVFRRSVLLAWAMTFPAAGAGAGPDAPPPDAGARFAAAVPAGYPRDADLGTIRAWLYDEYRRIAEDEHRRAEAHRPPPPPGSCGGVIGVMPTTAALPAEEWHRLAVRAGAEMASLVKDDRVRAAILAGELRALAFGKGVPALSAASLELAVVKLLDDPEPEVRCMALSLQRSDGPFAAAAKDAAIAALADPDLSVRRCAAKVLSSLAAEERPGENLLGPMAARAVERLLPLTADADRLTRIEAVRLIAKSGPHADAHIERFRGWLTGGDDLARRAAALAISDLGPRGGPLVPTLVDQAERGRGDARLRPIMALGRLGETAAPAVPALARIAEEGEGEASKYALMALELLGPTARPALPTLRRIAAGRSGTADLARSALAAVDAAPAPPAR